MGGGGGGQGVLWARTIFGVQNFAIFGGVEVLSTIFMGMPV